VAAAGKVVRIVDAAAADPALPHATPASVPDFDPATQMICDRATFVDMHDRKAPVGYESNYLKTTGDDGWFVYFRLYAPGSAECALQRSHFSIKPGRWATLR
jgi:hypothetical protein